jgi:Mg2+/Co2+ transporter CorB
MQPSILVFPSLHSRHAVYNSETQKVHIKFLLYCVVLLLAPLNFRVNFISTKLLPLLLKSVKVRQSYRFTFAPPPLCLDLSVVEGESHLLP